MREKGNSKGGSRTGTGRDEGATYAVDMALQQLDRIVPYGGLPAYEEGMDDRAPGDWTGL